MPRYEPGQLEEIIKSLVLDTIAESFSEKADRVESLEGSEQERGSIRERGRVKDPRRDKRLKQNRQAA